MNHKGWLAWSSAGVEWWMLGLEASTVIGLRLARIAAGGSLAARETELMVTEKVRAAMELQWGMMTGAYGNTALSRTQGTLKHYRGKVSANSRRLNR